VVAITTEFVERILFGPLPIAAATASVGRKRRS
jgi:hypothetical protein